MPETSQRGTATSSRNAAERPGVAEVAAALRAWFDPHGYHPDPEK